METDEIMEEDFEEASDEAETEYQYFNDPSSVQPSSGPPSTPNSCASSPPVNNEDPISPHRNVYSNILNQSGNTLVFNSGKPCAPKRGPGRPRKEYIPGIRSLKDGRILVKKYRGGITKLTSRKRIVGKDERGVLQGTSSDRGLYLNLLGSPTDLAVNNMDPMSADANERSLQHFEDMPYFPEKWPGKVCALCNLGERSQLGQGEMLRLQINESEQHFYSDLTGEEKGSSIGDVSPSSVTFPQFSNRRQKGLSKCKNPVITSEYVDELEKIGYFESTEFSNIQDGNYYYVHRLCATWSFGVLREPSGALDKTSSVISQSLRRKCSFCNRFGASVACKMSCPKFFHFPCVPASGGFQIIQNFVTFCKEHVNQVPLICTEDFNCRSCSGLGDVGNLVMCSICGDHYHGTCIGLPTIPGVRAGWQCKSCQRCQICRVPDVNEGRILSCEQCHKVYHLHCLRPVMSSIPKIGWKCRRCRVCSDCGSRTPGAGASSRWHAHYTVCDSCYQQRNKGFSCPICHRAYRAAAYREMVKCSWCNKVVHSTCDPEADLAVYHSRKENNPDYDYVCPPCKTLIQSGRVPQSLVRRSSHLEDDGSMISSQDGSTDQGEGEIFEKSSDYGLGKGKPYLGVKMGKKLSNIPFGQLVRNKGKLTFQKRTRISEFGRKRGTKTKMRGIFGVPGLGLQRPTPDPSSTRTEDEPGVENRLVLCSAKDKFILTQDICVMCGAVGTDQEGCLISCTQCGQCYHPYCVNVKVTKIILKKGWRCLDCTTCEGCGEKNDEARLILCDECDISFHIYCMDPPLEFVPQGNWKCKWCAVCQKCGSNNPGKNSTWKNSYSECGPCASQVSCSVCLEAYIDGELIIQCTTCTRWLHGKCDAIKNEDEAEKCDDSGYICILCRPKDVPPPHLIPQKKVPQISYSSNGVSSVHDEQMDISVSQSLEGSHYVDGVCLSEHGLNLIKSLQMEYVRKKRKKLTPDLVNNKDAAILAAIESVVAGSSGVDAIEDIKVEPLDPKEEAEIYKDGMIWERSDASPPEGFTLGTNEQGVVVLRKKRQRNLQKLGIGGFNVRNRTVKKDWFIKDDVEEHGENSLLLPPNENEKRKKPMRKRQKNKLTETYPPYLQEAFFGKSLLDTNKSFLESESSEDEAKSSVSDDKIIKLSPEELKILDEMKTEQKMHFEAPKENKDINYQKIPCDIKTSNDSVEIMKDIITPDLLEPELVDSIMKEENVLNENSNSLDVARDLDKKDSLNDIIPSNFNLDSIEINSKDVEDIFQGVIESDTKQSILTKTEPVILDTSTTTTPKDHAIRFITQDSKVVARFLPTQDFSSTSDKALDTQANLPCNINQNFMGLTDKTVGSNTPATFNTNPVQGAWSGITSNATKVADQPNVTVDETFVPAAAAQSNCSQKSSERMRRDEDLGEMATISAVLYANTNHPELKHDYPNWTDRCKQIYKRWRALSNDKKAPFLQQARDNRSALRMKKVQQAVDNKDKDTINLLLETNGESNGEDSSSSLCVEGLDEPKEPPQHKEVKPPPTIPPPKPETRNRAINVSAANIISLNYNINYLKEKFNLDNKPADFKESNYHKFFIRGNLQGPAPNVTVNANGVFNTNPKKVAHIYNPKLIRSNFPENKTAHSISMDFPFVNTATKEDTIVKPCFDAIRIKMDTGIKGVSSVLQDIDANKTNLDQNIRVLTPSEIMKTLPVMPGQESTSASDCSNPIQCDFPDQEKITSQQKALKEQEQERQWKQLQAMRAKEQQLQQFVAQGTQSTGNRDVNAPIIGDKDSSSNDKCSPFSPAPGTPHPQFATENSQSNIYGGQVTYQSNSPSNSCPANLAPNLTTNPNMIKQENKQLRDLLQRQESTDLTRRVLSSPSMNKQPTVQDSWNLNEANMTNPNNILNTTTFREPFPVSPLNKNTKISSNTCGPRTSLNLVQLTNKNVNVRQISVNKANLDVEKKTKRVKEQMPATPALSVDDIHKNEVKKTVQNKFKKEDIKSAETNNDIPEGVGNELDKLEPEESVGITEVEGVGDILGGLGEDDDDELLNSLTAEMGVDFNILEYADPELDALTDCNNANLLDKLDFDEADPEERSRKITMESNSIIKTEPVHAKELLTDQQLSVNNPVMDMQIKNKRIEDKFRKELSVGNQPEQKNFIVTQPPYSAGRVGNIDSMTNLKVGDIPKTSNFPRYNLISQNALCKISRGNLPPPPPPYPGPPPPYPSTIKTTRPNQEQPPLLLEDLLEQEKREQQQHLTSLVDNKPTQGNRNRIKSENLLRTDSVAVSGPWRKNANELNQTTVPAEFTTKIRKQSIFQNSSVQPSPPLPPDNIVTEHDRSMQLNYEQWLNNTNMVLTNQLKICEDEVLKLRKIRKSLNSKQRLMKKAGNELSQQDSMEFTKITGEQGVMQKHLENLRKQCRQHALLLQDYKTKHLAKLQMAVNSISSPVQMTSVSPMVSPSNNSPSTLLMQTSPSPIGSHILQPTRSPLQSPSPLLSHSPVGVSQSPVSQSNVSPYQNAQSSPRIGTPHSQIDENSFSPSANISSPSSMSGHHASPSPRITSPQQRGGTSQLSVRMSTSPGHPFGSIGNVQAQKFAAGPNVQDRGRGQLSQQCLSQNMSSMEIQAPLASPIQMNTFGQSPDGNMHPNRNVMHYFQQKHCLQRQQSAPPGMTKNKPHGSSPKPNSTPPPSPHLHYNIPHPQQNMNRKTPGELMAEAYVTQNDQHDQYGTQCRDNNMMTSTNDISSFLRNSQDSLAGGGGGLSGMGGNFLPSSGTISKFGRFGRIKLGLFGGSPMWGLSNMKNRGNGGEGQSKHLEGDNNSNRSHLLDETSSGNSALKSQGGNKLLSQTSHSQSSQASSESMSKSGKLCEGGILKSDINVNSIVVIDDSPNEKQRIMDYDDFQDKGFVATEVSLNSAAQNITDSDEMAVIESFASSQLADIVSSPLESEVAEEYVLFSSDVVDYPDSDDSMKVTPISQKHDDIHMKEENSTPSCLTSSSISRSSEQKMDDTLVNMKNMDVIQTQLPRSKSPEPKNFATAEDFEAMIDCRPSRKDEDKKRTEEINKITAEISNPMQINNNMSSANILTCNRIPFTAVTCGVITGMSTQTTTSPSVMVTSKKIVSDVTQATAKVSIGNTTISVPLLKTMSLNSSHIIPSEKSNKSGNVNLTKQPTILNVRGQKLNTGTIVSLSSLQIKPATNTKIVQATVVGKKLQLPQTSLDGVTNVKHNLIRSFNYPKLSSLTVLQDMSLPNKIFEDESASPENPHEQSDVEMNPHEVETSSQSNKVAEENQSKSVSDKTDSPQTRTEETKEEKINVVEIEPAKFQQRQLSTIPQLSPLSKPAEMTSNMANVSQQLRSIMSSINSSVQIENKTMDQKTSSENTTLSSLSTNSSANSEQNEGKKGEDAIERMSSNQAVTITSTASEDSKAISVYLTTTSSSSPKKPENIFVDLKKDTISSEKTHVSTATSTYSKMLPSATIITSISSEVSKPSTTPSHEDNKKLTTTTFSPHLKRSKSTDDGIEREVPAQITGTKRYSLEVISGKTDSSENSERISSKSPTVVIKSKETTSNICKTSALLSQHAKSDESQNVLLKQLLQNSSNSNTSNVAPQIITGRKVPALRAPSLGVVSSLEAQLARPVIPPVPTNPPSILQTGQHSMPPQSEPTIKDTTDEVKKATQIISRETSFVSNPLHKTLQTISERIEKPPAIQNNNNETSISSVEKKIPEDKRLPTESSTNTTSSIQKEGDEMGHKPSTYIDEIKSISDATQSPKRPSSTAQPASAEPLEETESTKDDKSKALDPESINNELKKRRKREYQKNRRQMLNKEVLYSKKRSRKLSKLEEDYDNFIENLMVQLRQMPSLQVLEPLLSRNYGVCPPYGAGDFSKTGYAKDCHSFSGNLYGAYGNAFSANIVDFYNIKPFGYMDVPPEDSPSAIQNGFYDQEFPPIKFDSEADQIYKLENMFKDRDIDTPESIVTSSSPECVVWDAALSFPGLKVIKEPDETSCFDRMSPVVPVIAPIPIKLQAGMDLSLDKNQTECCKENGLFGEWRKRINQQSLPVKDSNVTVTLTLTSSAAEDIMGVLRDLANILRIPPPTSYQIVERTTTPPSQKLGLYRTRGKDGKEGNPIDIQTILNGTAKFCRHCDVVILNTIIRAKASEFPLLTASELINNTDDLYFCSKTCYKQFKWRPTNIIEDNMLSVAKANSSFKPGAGKQGAWMEVKNEFFDRESGKLLRSVEEGSDKMDGASFSSNSQSSKTEQNVKNEYSDKSGSDAASRSMRYRFFSQNTFHSPSKYKRTTEKEVTEMLFKMNITVTPTGKTPDTRQCIFCGQIGDGVADGPSRLLNFDVDKWVHLNCALWSDGVYETVNGGLMNLEAALQASLYQSCTVCHHLGATIKCFKNRCSNIYHLSCAIKDQCVFYKNKTTHCQSHALKNEKENELTTLSVQRRVYVERDESRQVAAVMHHSELSNLLRVGSLTFLSIGQLLPHQLQAFHTPNYIYPIGYKIIRFYWSMRRPNKRCRYICSIADAGGRPEFRILVQEPSEEDMELRDASPRAVWQRILEPIASLRKNCDLVQLFPKYVTGEDLFGLTEPAVVRILESLPGIETLTDYRFKYGRNPLLELPLAINPSGAARTELKQKQSIGWRKPHTQRSGSTNQRLPLTPTTSVAGEVACPYSKQFVHSKSSQYKKMKQEWRNNVYLARSKIQGLGLYAARDLEKHTMVIEYIGEVIRTEVSEIREKQYEARNRGIYMFRLDEDRVVDATLSGGLARYINHSCNPNCVTEIVEVDREYRIIIFAKRRINRGEELSYDYKFDIEDDAHKISCMCGAPNCRKWMN